MRRFTVLSVWIFLLLGLIPGGKVFAGIEPYQQVTKGKLKPGDTLLIRDSRFRNPTFRWSDINNIWVKDAVTFRLTDQRLVNKDFTCTATVRIEYLRSPDQMVPDTQQVRLQINYSVKKGAVYKMKDAYTFSGAYWMRVTLLSISSAELGPDLPAAFELGGDIRINRKYKFDPRTTVKLNGVLRGTTTSATPIKKTSSSRFRLLARSVRPGSGPVNGGAQLQLYWSKDLSADEYDLEWTTVDSGSKYIDTIGKMADSTAGTISDTLLNRIFRNNATRVTTSDTAYLISLVSNDNYILVRVRNVQYNPTNGIRLTGAWDYSKGSGKYAVWGLSWYQENLNWQYSAAYAEEAKKKEVVSYFDGTLRGRQTVTINNSDNVAVAQENVYDEFGRATASILPAPHYLPGTTQPMLQYFKNFNVNGLDSAYNTDNVHGLTSDSCEFNPDSLKADSGASLYYSHNNPYLTDTSSPNYKRYNFYIPDAAGYPLSVTQYTADNTGRIKLQGGVGKIFQPGDTPSKTTRYYYGKPEQWELDQLFGNDVGYASHYLKNMVVDPNGQISISYVNASGKTIATALTGPAPATMDSLTSSVPVTRKTLSLLDSSKFVFDNTALTLSATTTYLASLADSAAVIKYDIKKLVDTYPNIAHKPICSSCYYDLTVQIYDDCNHKVFHNTTPIKIGTADTTVCDTSGAKIDSTFSARFPQPGEYYVTFTLAYSKTVIENYTNHFINKAKADSILTWEFDYVKPYLDSTDFKSCLSDCSTCQLVLGTQAHFTATIKSKMLALDLDTASVSHGAFSAWIANKYTTLKAYCDSLHAHCGSDTTVSSPCQKYMQPMLDDVSPGGQYALFDTTYMPLDTANNVLNKYWRVQFPATAKTDTTIYNSALITLPDGTITSAYDSTFTVSLLAKYWNNDWAQRFLQYHPEYCKLKFCWANEASEYWDQTVQDSILTASAIGNIPNAPPGFHYNRSNAAWLTAADPFFRTGGMGHSDSTAFANDLANYTKNALGYTTVSTKSVTGFVDFLLYCSDPNASTNTLKNPTNNWDNCAPVDSCRVIDREWSTYKDFYFQLKQQYYTKVRANTTCANKCQVGQPASLPTNSACPDVSDFTLNDYSSADGTPTDSCGTGTKLVTLAFVPGNVATKVKITLSYAPGTNTTGLPTSFTFRKGQRDTMFCVPASIPSSSITITSTVCDSCKVNPMVFNTWSNAYIIQQVYSGGTVVSTKRINVDTATLFPGTLTINPDNTYNVVTTFHPYSGSWEQNDSCQFALYSNGVRYLESAVSTDSLSLTHLEGNIRETWHYGSVSSAITCSSPDVINVASLRSNNVYYQGSYPTRHLITVIPGSPGTPPPFTCINSTGDTSTSTSAYHTCLKIVTADSIAFKYQNVWVFNCVYDNVPSSCSPTLLTKQSQFNDTYLQPVIGDTSTVVSQNKAALTQEISSSCVANSNSWMTALDSGLMSHSADTAALRAALIHVCEAGGDINHPFGASTIAPGVTPPGGYSSFGDAIKGVLGLSSYNTKLNPWLISMPYAYSPRQQGAYTIISNTSPAICNILSNLQHQCDSVNTAHGTHLTLYQYLVQTYGDAMFLTAGDVDSLKKSCNNCRFILPYDVTLPVFMDPLSKGCIIPAEYSAGKSALAAAFGGSIDTADVRYQTIFTNFMNQRWGFTLSYYQYKVYEDSLLTNPNKTLCNTITSVAPPTDSLACIESQIATAVGNGKAAYATYISSQKDLFRASYVSTCSNASPAVNLTTNQKIYHYTLYYYDQADNLVRTIPPEGVALLDSAQISLVDRSRNNNPLDCNYTGPSTDANKTTAFNALSTTLSANLGAIEFWLYEDGTTQNHLVEITPDKKYLFQMNIVDSTLAIDIYPAAASGTTGITFNPASIHYRADISNQLPLDPFTHVVLQGDSLGTANTAQLYVNGALFTATKTNTTVGPGFTVGSTGTGIIAPDSIQTLKHLRLYSQPLSTGVIWANANNTCFMPTDSSHMTGWYRFNVPAPGGPTTINDSSTVETRLPAVYPVHRLATNYQYNSTNQVSTQNSPDGGTNRFWYDLLSRLVISQNDKQKPDSNYSYTKYDTLGRITEVAQKYHTASMGTPDYLPDATIKSFYTAGTNSQIMNTYYDTVVMAGNGIQNVGQTNIAMRKRVSLTTYRTTQSDTVTQATYYDYDLDGNVKNLYQQVAGLGIKRLNYQYDLISGKVNFVAYQNGKHDQFFYQYFYDADNRMTQAWSSINADTSTYWQGSKLDPPTAQMDVSYQYYLHGPLARAELGDTSGKVQGIDYAYTLQGWQKGVNSQILNPALDMGRDSVAVAKDAYGYSLGYYHNDYKLIGGTGYPAFVNEYTQNMGDITGQSLYNGNISTATYAINSINSGAPVGYTYHYDQLNRIKKLRQSTSIVSWNNGTFNATYSEDFTYDGNGNILSLLRSGSTATVKDSLLYQYGRDANGNLANNKLNWLSGVGNATNFGPPQSSGNYLYDPIGNLVSDAQSHLGHIAWTVYGKIDTIKRGSDTTITYTYNTAQQRVAKKVASASNNLTTYYLRDAQGNFIAVYDDKAGNSNWREQHLYGSARLGMWQPDVNLATDSAHIKWGTKGLKEYDLVNQTGNVLATISDKRLVDPVHSDYVAEVKTAQDFFAFGAIMPGRSFNSDSARFGFNGKENDNEVEGIGNWQNYGARMYAPRIGRFPNVDPIQTQYPELSSYQFSSNSPISGIDRDGLEFLKADESTVQFTHGRLELKVENLPFFPRHNIEYQMEMSKVDPSFWTVKKDGTRDIGFSLAVADISFFKPKNSTPNFSDIPEKDMPKQATGQSASGVQSEAYNRAGRRDIARKGPIVDVPANGGSLSKGLAIFDATMLVINQVTTNQNIAAQDAVTAHIETAGKAVDIVNKALRDGMIPTEFQNSNDLLDIMNVVLQGVSDSKKPGLHDLGIKIYNKYNPPKTIDVTVPSHLDAQPSKTYTIPATNNNVKQSD